MSFLAFCVPLASLEPSDYGARPMTTPQDPGRRRKEKARRTKQLAAWRDKKAAEGASAKPAAKSPRKSG